MAMILQSLAAKLGIASGRDLAKACGERYSPPTRVTLSLLCDAAIVACDLAEVTGTAVTLQLLVAVMGPNPNLLAMQNAEGYRPSWLAGE